MKKIIYRTVMDIELLRTFLEVNRLRHFGQVGEGLHITQAAVSARIKQLEGKLGVKLFVRQYHDLQLTPEGHRLVRHADLIISGWRKARQEVAMGGAIQQLTIGGSLRIWDVVLQEWFNKLRSKLPKLAIIAESHTPELLTRRLLDGQLDVAFMLEPAMLELLQIKEIALIDLSLISSKVDQNVEQALGENYIMVDWGLAHALEHRRLFPDAPEPQIRVAQARMALAQMLDFGGSAYLPVRMIHDNLLAGELYLVADAPSLYRHAYAVYPIRSSKMALISSVLEYFEYSVKIDRKQLLKSD